MAEFGASDPFHGLFVPGASLTGRIRLNRRPSAPTTLPDPKTGHALRIATVELSGAICPVCREHADGGFVYLVADPRLVFACPHCHDLVWINGA